MFFALYGVDGEKFLEQEVAGKQIKDNELLRFDFEKIQVDGRTGKNYNNSHKYSIIIRQKYLLSKQ